MIHDQQMKNGIIHIDEITHLKAQVLHSQNQLQELRMQGLKRERMSEILRDGIIMAVAHVTSERRHADLAKEMLGKRAEDAEKRADKKIAKIRKRARNEVRDELDALRQRIGIGKSRATAAVEMSQLMRGGRDIWRHDYGDLEHEFKDKNTMLDQTNEDLAEHFEDLKNIMESMKEAMMTEDEWSVCEALRDLADDAEQIIARMENSLV